MRWQHPSRSGGTTWLAEMLASTPDSAAVLEPDNPAWHKDAAAARRLHGAFPTLHSDEAAPDYERIWDRAFAGESALWTAQAQRRWSRGRSGKPENLILKSVHFLLAVDWLKTRYAPRFVLIERNPLNVISSWLQYGFEPYGLARQERFHDEFIEPMRLPEWDPYAPRVLQVAWAVGAPIRVFRHPDDQRQDWTVVSHETLCSDPSTNLRVLAE